MKNKPKYVIVVENSQKVDCVYSIYGAQIEYYLATGLSTFLYWKRKKVLYFSKKKLANNDADEKRFTN